MSDNQHVIDQLTENLTPYNWFAGKVMQDPSANNSVIVYVHYMSGDVLQIVPDKIDGVGVAVHFLSSCPTEIKDYVNRVNVSSMPKLDKFVGTRVPLSAVPKEVRDEPNLQEILWNLTRECGRDNLISVFFEVHDGDDAVTNVSEEYPMVRKAMEKLYVETDCETLMDALNV
jgi:hypothetical protein